MPSKAHTYSVYYIHLYRHLSDTFGGFNVFIKSFDMTVAAAAAPDDTGEEEENAR